MAEQLFKIPLDNTPQRFAIELAGQSLVIVSQWNGEMPAWTIDIIDGATEQPLIMCLPLVSGVDLLAQHEYIGIPGQLIIYTDGDEFAPPTLENLGQEANLYYLVDIA